MLGKHTPQRIARSTIRMAPLNLSNLTIVGTARLIIVKRVHLLTLNEKQSLLNVRSKRGKDSSSIQRGMLRRARRSNTASLVAAVPMWIANRIVGAAIHQLAKVDVMCLKTKMYRMLIVRR